ncbi:fructosamine kinase family protein [Gallaecimonas sp. GXIMD4217]|uniref:fructosamine kinase family protein n=1 Tax=Gallaecimonas sp. GXIMD4217 TaxID=3131927 RepID=UPI00311AEF71
MWKALSDEVTAALGRPYLLQDRQPISGGDTHRAYCLTDGQLRLFAKVAPVEHGEILASEAFGLAELAKTGQVRVPEVVTQGQTEAFSYLVLEYLPLGQPEKGAWQKLGELLAALHGRTDQAMYGFDEDNFIGLTDQRNGWHKHWDQFFAEQRLGYQLTLLAEKGERLGDIEELVACAKNLLHGHQPRPALLHGDLWSGNVGFLGTEPVLFDPACYYGDREADIAMTELFGRLDPDFYDAYDNNLPLDADYELRRSLYNLYHLLNHANLFGGHYLQQAKAQLKQVLAFC